MPEEAGDTLLGFGPIREFQAASTTFQKKVKLETKHDIKHMEPIIIISERKIGGQKKHLLTQFIKINPARNNSEKKKLSLRNGHLAISTRPNRRSPEQ